MKQWLQFAVIVLVTALTWGYSLGGAFISDDWPMVAENPHLTPGSLPDYFTQGVWANSKFELPEARLYRPFYLVWYLAVRTVAGPSPVGFHLAQLFLHATNAVLVLLLLGRFFPRASVQARLVGTLVFVVWPVHVQSIAWISGGTDPVAAAFFLGGTLAYLHARDGSTGWGVASLALFAGAMLTKEVTVVFPAVLLAVDYFQFGVRGRRLWDRWRAASVLLVVAYLVARGLVTSGSGLVLSAQGVARVMEQTVATARYLAIPWPQVFYFRYPSAGLLGPAGVILGVGALLVAGIVAWRTPPWRFWLAWAALTASVTLALGLHADGVFAFRFLYLPVVALAALVPALEKDRLADRRAVGVAAVLLLAGMLAADVRFQRAWRDETAFYSMVEKADPLSPAGYEGAARARTREGDSRGTVEVLRRGLSRINVSRDRVPLLQVLGLTLADMGRHEESLAAYREWSELEPGAEPLVGVGNNLWMLGDTDRALQAYQEALLADPENSLALGNVAQLSLMRGDSAAARRVYERLMSLPPESVDPAARTLARRFLGR